VADAETAAGGAQGNDEGGKITALGTLGAPRAERRAYKAKVKELLLSEDFWNDCRTAYYALRPLAEAQDHVTSDKGLTGEVYDWMLDRQEKYHDLEMKRKLTSEQAGEATNVFERRWETLLHSHLHAAGRRLHPKYFGTYFEDDIDGDMAMRSVFAVLVPEENREACEEQYALWRRGTMSLAPEHYQGTSEPDAQEAGAGRPAGSSARAGWAHGCVEVVGALWRAAAHC